MTFVSTKENESFTGGSGSKTKKAKEGPDQKSEDRSHIAGDGRPEPRFAAREGEEDHAPDDDRQQY